MTDRRLPRPSASIVVPALALLVGCGGGSSSSGAPFIGATIVGLSASAAGTGVVAGASVEVRSATTGASLAGAVVNVNGVTLTLGSSGA